MTSKHKREAQAFLLRHYWKTFRHFWKKRDQLGGNLFTQDEAEFLPAALSIQEKPVARGARLAAAVLVLLVIVLVAWAVIGRMDIVVSASGKIITSGRTKLISSIEVASVRAIYVEEGQSVKKGDVLIELDSRIVSTDRDKAVHANEQAMLQMAGAKALIKAVNSLEPQKLTPILGFSADKLNDAQDHLDSQYNDFYAKLKRLDGMIKTYSQALPLATQTASDYKELSKTNDVPQHAYLEKEQARIELEGRLSDAKDQRAALIAETKRVAGDSIVEGEKIIGAAQPEVQKASLHRELLKLVSPVDGTVQQLAVHTIGGVVPAAQPLMEIVPRKDQIEVEAMVLNKDIGFVKEDQTAEVKVEAFQYTKYGLIPARVVHISRDAIKDEKLGLLYSVIVALKKSALVIDGREVQLSPGMSVSVDIKTGDRRLIEYILSPLLKMKQESLRER
jgi:hemolysin D